MNHFIPKNVIGSALLCLVASTQIAVAGPLVLHPEVKPLPTKQQGPFVTTGDGGILCVDAQKAWRSDDEGKTWKSSPLFHEANRFQVSNERALLRTRKGVVIAAWMNLKERSTAPGFRWGGPPGEFKQWILPTYVCRSLDEGKTWEEPIKINTPWCGCIHSMIETREGRIVLVGQEVSPDWRHVTVMFVSDDQGQTWKRSNILDYGRGRHDHAGSIEATVVERQDGTLYQLLRTESGFLYEATSKDGGLTWENLKPSKVRSVTCCAQMARLADGRVALLWNHPPRHDSKSPHSREELSLAFSEDDARTWSNPIVIAARYDSPTGKEATNRRVSYPYLYERKPGELWITTMQGDLRMKISVADLSRGEIPVHKPLVAKKPLPHGLFMFGDSTTAHRPGAIKKVYSVRLQEALLAMGSSLNVYNAGKGSNTTRDALARFERDVLQHKPRIVVIQFGINDSAVDVWKSPPATQPRVPIAEYEANLRQMIARARKQNAKVILMTTNHLRWTDPLKKLYGKPPYDPESAEGFDAPLLKPYNERIRALAKELDTGLVDVRSAFE
ncbi:MAG: exo-alpha-sialidase, partial [Planctomycetaceae bacterium]|nr:exo-alpha-sialidase [Planctomycetaceae bacterium]